MTHLADGSCESRQVFELIDVVDGQEPDDCTLAAASACRVGHGLDGRQLLGLDGGPADKQGVERPAETPADVVLGLSRCDLGSERMS